MWKQCNCCSDETLSTSKSIDLTVAERSECIDSTVNITTKWGTTAKTDISTDGFKMKPSKKAYAQMECEFEKKGNMQHNQK